MLENLAAKSNKQGDIENNYDDETLDDYKIDVVEFFKPHQKLLMHHNQEVLPRKVIRHYHHRIKTNHKSSSFLDKSSNYTNGVNSANNSCYGYREGSSNIILVKKANHILRPDLKDPFWAFNNQVNDVDLSHKNIKALDKFTPFFEASYTNFTKAKAPKEINIERLISNLENQTNSTNNLSSPSSSSISSKSKINSVFKWSSQLNNSKSNLIVKKKKENSHIHSFYSNTSFNSDSLSGSFSSADEEVNSNGEKLKANGKNKPNSILFDILERENTNFSIKLQYENALNLNTSNSPHTYLDLVMNPNLKREFSRQNTIKSIKGSQAISVYQHLQNPSSINVYAVLNKNETKKKRYARRALSKLVQMTKSKSNKTKPKNDASNSSFVVVNYEGFDDIKNLKPGFKSYYNSSLFDNDGSAKLKTLDEQNHQVNSSSKDYNISNKHTTALSYSTNSLIQENTSFKINDAIKETTSKFKLNNKNNYRLKRNRRSFIKEFKHCILTDLKIGEGEFSETFQGYRYDKGAPIKIAAKRLKHLKEEQDDQTTINLLAEISVLSQLGKHEHVIEYMGVNRFNDTMYMVFEYAEKGDLKRLLDQCRKSSKRDLVITNLYKLKIGYEVASGMDYLGSLDIVHKDLAARNILLDKDYNCKISDFGCCKSEFLAKRPIRWMAPESLNRLLFTQASDVWSFGVLLWEVYTLGITPYPGMTDDEVIGRINQWYRLYKPFECPNEVYAIMLSCWKEYSKARPRFSNIKNKFRDLHKSLMSSEAQPT